MGCLPKAHSFCSTTFHLLTRQHITGNMCGSKQLKNWHAGYFPGISNFWKVIACNDVTVQVLPVLSPVDLALSSTIICKKKYLGIAYYD